MEGREKSMWVEVICSKVLRNSREKMNGSARWLGLSRKYSSADDAE
jgi:hypothetical protein